MLSQKLLDDIENIKTQAEEWQSKVAGVPALQQDVTDKQNAVAAAQVDLQTSQAALQTYQDDTVKEGQDIVDAIAKFQSDLQTETTGGGGETPPGGNGGDTPPAGNGGTDSGMGSLPQASQRRPVNRR